MLAGKLFIAIINIWFGLNLILSIWFKRLCPVEFSEYCSSRWFRNMWSGCFDITNSIGWPLYLRRDDAVSLFSEMGRSTRRAEWKPNPSNFLICSLPDDESQTIGRSAALLFDSTLQRIFRRTNGNFYGVSFRFKEQFNNTFIWLY